MADQQPATAKPLTVMINGVGHTVDMARIDALHARIQAGPGESPGEKVAVALACTPLVAASDPLQPDPDSRGD